MTISLEWSYRATLILRKHVRSFAGDQRKQEIARIRRRAEDLQHAKVGGAWVQGWAVRAAIAGKIINDHFNPDDFVEHDDLAKKRTTRHE